MSHERKPVEYIQQMFAFDEDRREEDANLRRVRESLAPYIDVPLLRDYAAKGIDIRQALRFEWEELPEGITALLDTLKVLLTPSPTEQITSPRALAALLMVDMGFLQQEQLKVACLDTRNRLQKLHLVYQGSLNTSMIRIGELFREPIRLNSAGIILAHNHPSGEPMPSPEDVLVTRNAIEAGALLDCEVLDHIVVGAGKWVSMRERGLGFEKRS